MPLPLGRALKTAEQPALRCIPPGSVVNGGGVTHTCTPLCASEKADDPHYVCHTLHDTVHVHTRAPWHTFSLFQRMRLHRHSRDHSDAGHQNDDNDPSSDLVHEVPLSDDHALNYPLPLPVPLPGDEHPHPDTKNRHWSLVDLFLRPHKESQEHVEELLHHDSSSSGLQQPVTPDVPPHGPYQTPSIPPPPAYVSVEPGFEPTVSQKQYPEPMRMNSLSADDEEFARVEAECFRRLQEYKFIKVLGAGAQGTVSLRLHVPTSSLRALKSIPTSGSTVDSHVVDSFRREVQILQEVRRHPNVIRLIDAFESQYTVYQVFDVCTGGDASMDGVFNNVWEAEAVRLIAPIADALRYLHGKGIIHRDTRPANIFLRRAITGHESLRELEQIPVLADFGIANYMRNSGRLGAPFPETPAHIAPEILDGARFTTASDCYGLGFYALHVFLRRPPRVVDVRAPLEIEDSESAAWMKCSQGGKEAVAGLLNSDPWLRTSASGFCTGRWVAEQNVDCVKHTLLI
ncbi:kinase-like domain-containing protein [Chytriomyces sp. MP71]|nr:kinase-like domain-containing protein [Chytriomyces sp. MP71]